MTALLQPSTGATPVRDRALGIGVLAHRALASAPRGRVAAVFRRALYLRFGDGWACLGDRSIGHGPLNLPCAGAVTDWRTVAAPGQSVACDGATLWLAGGAVALAPAPCWAPAPLPRWDPAALETGLAALVAALPPALPAGGLAAFLRADPAPEPVAQAARPAVAAMGRWLRGGAAAPGPDAAVGALLGLGPGLTPSGDDFLGGYALALRAAGREAALRRLGHRVAALAPERTHELSRAHLRAAFAVGLGEDLDDLARALLAGAASAVEAGSARLAAAGHHSPWDGLAGFVSGCRAAMAAAG